MTLGSEENYINATDKLCVGRASTGVDRRRGLPNNRLQNSADIPDFHPRFHLNNDAGKLSRLMVATRKYKKNYDMQASRKEGQTQFYTQKTMVNNYALSTLVLWSQNYLLKELASIASRNLTVTDPQPNKIHFDITQPKYDHYPSQCFH
jgi:hypothetical protein